LHLCDDYQQFGPLDNCSAFAYENYMKELKSKGRKNEKPLEQLTNRYSEIYTQHPHYTFSDTDTSVILSKPHRNGPLISSNNSKIQYKKLNINKININTNISQDSYILIESGEVVRCLNIVKNVDNSISVIGNFFKKKNKYFIVILLIHHYLIYL